MDRNNSVEELERPDQGNLVQQKDGVLQAKPEEDREAREADRK